MIEIQEEKARDKLVTEETEEVTEETTKKEEEAEEMKIIESIAMTEEEIDPEIITEATTEEIIMKELTETVNQEPEVETDQTTTTDQ